MSPCRTLFAILAFPLFSLLPSWAIAQQPPPDLASKLDQVVATINTHMTGLGSDAAQAAGKIARTGLSGKATTAILAALCARRPNAVDCTTLDPQGTILAAAPSVYARLAGSSIGDPPYLARLKGSLKATWGGPYLNPEGFHGVDYAFPVLSNGALVAILRLAARPFAYLQAVVEPMLSWDTSDVWVMQTDGKILYSRYHNDIGDNPWVTPAAVTGSSLTGLIKQIMATPEGTGSFTAVSTGKADPQKQTCVWKTVSLADRDMRVVVFGARENN